MAGARPMSSEAGDSAVPAADFDRAHAELLADRSIQFELPPIADAQGSAPGWRGSPVNPPRFEPRDVTGEPTQSQAQPAPAPPAIPAPIDPGPLALAFFWIIVGLIAAGLLYMIVSRLAGWRRSPRGNARTEAEPDWQIDEEPARQLMDEADLLAAEGRYSEAAHLLLHRSISEIDRRRPATVRRALTSRDIAALPAIPPSPADAFSAIVRAVERSLFGGRPLDSGDWQACRDAYQRFAFAREWQA